MSLALFDFAFLLFARATLQHAVRSGVRFAILGEAPADLGHDDSIKNVVKLNALGLLSTPEDLAKVQIEYFLPNCAGAGCSTGTNGASNIIVISVNDYMLSPVGPLLRFSGPVSVNVAAVDKMEPFPGQPPPRTLEPET